MNNLTKNIIALSIALLFSFLSTEIAVRLLWHETAHGYPIDLYIPDKNLGYKYKPNYHGFFLGTDFYDIPININSKGLRDKEYDYEKNNKYRVLMIGDSVTFGSGVRENDTFENRIEQNLNIEAIFANINTHLPVIFPENSIDRFFINFPDPWFKKEHKKRRIMKPQTVKELVKALKPTGEIFFQSDIYDLALNALAVMEEYSGLKNVSGEWSFMRENPYGAISRRERFVTEEGKRVWRFLFSK